MLQTIRQYASEEIEGSGEAKAVGRRHADYFVSLAEAAEPALAGPEQAARLERLEREHDNMRAALGWLGEERDAERGSRLAAALLRFWWFRGHLAEGRAQLEGLLHLYPAAPIRDETRAKALHALGILIYRHTNYAGDCWTVARARLDESLAIYRRLGDEARVATVLQELGPIVAELGDLAAARSFLDESLEIGRRSGHEPGIARSLIYLGVSCLTGGDHTSARAYLTESLETFRRLDDKFWINACLVHLGYVDCEEGDHVAARSRFLQMAETAPLAQFPWGATYTLEGFARLAAAEGQATRALRLGGATAALRQTYGVAIGPSRQVAFRRALGPAWQALDEEECRTVFEEGRAMTLEEAIAYALEKAEKRPGDPSKSRLTPREVEVLSLVAEGLSDAEVAEKLYVSPRTVGGHLRGVYGKLGVKSRTAAIKKAGELGLI
jgi:ATP/maltotriose-dependent transcriptional regulator MalT